MAFNTPSRSEKMSTIKSALILGIVAAIWCRTGVCFSEEQPQSKNNGAKIVILSMTSCCEGVAWPEAEASVAEELETFNVRIVHVDGKVHVNGKPPSPGTSEATLVDVANKNDATVVLHLFRQDAGFYRADILLIPPGAPPERQHLTFETKKNPDGLQTAVLRIVETVGALLFPGESASAEIESDNSVKETSEKEVSKKEKNIEIGVGIGLGAIIFPGGARPSMAINGDVHSTFATHLMLELNLVWAFYSEDISYNGETATVGMGIVRGSLFWSFIPQRRIHPAIGLGAGAMVLNSSGRSDSSDDTQNFDERATAVYLGVAGRLAVDVSSQAAFILNAKTGFLVPRIEVFLREQLAATYGRPLIELGVGFEYRFL